MISVRPLTRPCCCCSFWRGTFAALGYWWWAPTAMWTRVIRGHPRRPHRPPTAACRRRRVRRLLGAGRVLHQRRDAHRRTRPAWGRRRDPGAIDPVADPQHVHRSAAAHGRHRGVDHQFGVGDLDAVVAELRQRGVVFEQVDVPGLRTIDGIAEIADNYPPPAVAASAPPGFATARANCTASARRSRDQVSPTRTRSTHPQKGCSRSQMREDRGRHWARRRCRRLCGGPG
jgi:hypothetical protein